MPQIATLTARGHPADQVAHQYPEINLIGPLDRPGCGKGFAHPVTVGRMNVGGQVFETDGLRMGHAPHLEGLPVHGEGVGIDVPGPQGDAGRRDSVAKLCLTPGSLLGSGRDVSLGNAMHQPRGLGYASKRNCGRAVFFSLFFSPRAWNIAMSQALGLMDALRRAVSARTVASSTNSGEPADFVLRPQGVTPPRGRPAGDS